MVRTEYRSQGVCVIRKSINSVNRHLYKNHEMEINTGYNCNSKDDYRINYLNAEDKQMIKTMGPSTE